MEKTEYEGLVAGLGENERAILEEARRRGKASVRLLRPVTKSPSTGAPLAYGLTRELRKLQELGLLRQVKPAHPAHYEAVPLAQVEEAAKRYELRGKRKRKRRRSPSARIAELRIYEHGDYSEFYRVHRRVVELTDYVGRYITKMAFWAAAPKDDLARTAQDLADLQEALDQAFACLKQRADDDDLLAKIEKLSVESGRTPGEIENARTLARRLKAQYDQRVGP